MTRNLENSQFLPIILNDYKPILLTVKNQIRPDALSGLDSNCLQILSADNTGRQRVKVRVNSSVEKSLYMY